MPSQLLIKLYLFYVIALSFEEEWHLYCVKSFLPLGIWLH